MKCLLNQGIKTIRHGLSRWLMGFIIFLLLLVLLAPEVTRRKITFGEGDIAIHDLYAPLRFPVPNHESTEKMRREAMSSVMPVYILNRRLMEERKKLLEEFFGRLETLRLEREKAEEKRPLSEEEEARLKGNLNLSHETLVILLGDIEIPRIKEESLRLVNMVLSQGLVAERIDLPLNPRDKISLRERDAGLENKREVSSLLILKELNSYLSQEVASSLRHYSLRNAVVELVESTVAVNVWPDKSETLRRKEEIGRTIPLQCDLIEKDEVIVRKGEKINALSLARIKAMEESLTKSRRPLRILGLGILIAIIIHFFLLYGHLLEASTLDNNSNLAAIGLILIVTLMTARLSLVYNFSLYLVPMAAGGMLVTLLFTPGLGIIQALLLSTFIGVMTSFNFLFLMLGLISSVVGIYRIKEASRRTDLIKAGGLVGLSNLVIILAWGWIKEISFPETLVNGLLGLANGLICAFLVTGCLPFFEYFLKVTTNIRLLELSDLNHPLLKDLALKAPGTFQSCILTGTLAEAAAGQIGANALLARVGAYFHDIGKLKKPAFYTENQIGLKNRHEDLTSTISGLMLISHVKEGLELAQRYRLPHRIIEIIQEHHGTTLVFYFYHRALEEMKGEEIAEQNFRYPGPKPQSKEAAIVLLADSVEAASRSLAEPSPGRLENLVKKIINNKFIDYQLDECDLTLKDLNKIGQTFIHHLTGIFHSRVSYPEKDAQDINNQSPEKNPS